MGLPGANTNQHRKEVLSLFDSRLVFRDPIPMIETQSSPTYTISYRFQHSKPLKGDLKETKETPRMEEDENIRGSFSDAAFMTTGLLMIIAGSLPLPMSGWRGRCRDRGGREEALLAMRFSSGRSDWQPC